MEKKLNTSLSKSDPSSRKTDMSKNSKVDWKIRSTSLRKIPEHENRLLSILEKSPGIQRGRISKLENYRVN